MKRIYAVAALALALFAGSAKADYFIIDGKNQLKTIRSGTIAITGGTAILPYYTMVDASANPVGTSGNPLFVSLTAGGSSYTVSFAGAIGALGTPTGFKDGSGNFQALLGDVPNGIWVNLKAAVPLSLTGTLPSFGSAQHFICDSGCSGGGGGGVSATFGGAIGTLGTPVGFKDGSGNFQPLLGDVTNGQWVSVKGTLPAFAATPTVNIGTAPTITVTGTVTANAGTNLNTSALALETGGNLAQLVTDFGAPGATACTTDTASCNLNQQMQRNNQRLTSVITALGSPFQAGGSIGNTSFGISGTLPAFAATPTFNFGTLNGAATAANQTSVIGPVTPGTAATNSLLVGGTFNSSPITVSTGQQAPIQVDANGFLKVNVAAGGASGGTSSTFAATFPSTGTAAGMSQGGNMVALTGTSGNLNVQCANCSGSGASAVDAATFTAGTSVFAPTGGQFTSGGATACVTGHQCLSAMTADRALFVNVADINGVTVLTGTGAVGTGAQRVAVGTDTATIAGSAPGTAGTASSNVLSIQGIASMTPVQVSQATAANLNATVVGTGTFAVQAAQSGAWNITNISGTVSLPTGASTSALQPTNAAIASTTAAQTGHLMMGAVTTAAPTYTTAQTDPLSLTTAGALRVDGSGVTQPVSLTSTTIIGTVAVTQSGAWSLSANQSVNVAQINGVTPLMGNGVTGTGSQRVTIASDNTAFTVNAAQSGAWNITNISGTVSLPTLAATSTKQSDGTQKTQIVDGSGNVIASTSNNLNVQCANCSGSGVSAADAATFTAGTSLFAPIGGQFTSGGATACVTGHECTAGMTAARAIFMDMASIAGTATLTGNGTAGAGAQRVTIASDNTAFAVNATLQASATTAIGKVDPNTIGTWGLQVATQNSATPTNGGLVLGQFNTTPTTISTGNVSPLQLDNAGNLLVNVKAGGAGGGAVTGGTASSVAMQNGATANGNGTTLTVTGYQTALVNVNCSVACSGGTTINFEGTDSTGTFFSLAAFPVTGTTSAVSSATTSGQFWVPVSGLTTIRARISAYSAGTITVTGTPIFGVNASLSQVANTNVNGQQTMANSSPVVFASNQSALTVNNPTAANLLASVSGASSNASSGVATGSTNVPAIAYLYGFNGTAYDQLQVDGSKFLKVNVSAALPAGTNLMGKVGIDQTTPGTTNGVQDAATGSTGATAPTKSIESGAIAQNAEATAVTNGQLKSIVSDLVGKQIVLPYANPENFLNGEITTAMTGTTSTAVTGMGAQGAGVRNYITSCSFSNSHATVGTMILLQDGSAGTTLWQQAAAPAFGGGNITFPTPIKTTANTGLFAQNVTTGSNTFVSCAGYKGI